MSVAKRNIKLVIEYDGGNYSGWQWQEGVPTVQSTIADALGKVVGEPIIVNGAGRTDAGVHALGQVANFRVEHQLAPERYRDALNYYLPPDIRIKQSEEVPDWFNARRDAVFRRYRYLVAGERSALFGARRWEYGYPLVYEHLQEAAKLLVGTHDFSPFCVTTSLKPDNQCEIFHARWYRYGNLYSFEIRGNRFLHGMVRSLVGGMVNLASASQDANPDNLTLAGFADIIRQPHGRRVIFTAPAHGLYLVSVSYQGVLP